MECANTLLYIRENSTVVIDTLKSFSHWTRITWRPLVIYNNVEDVYDFNPVFICTVCHLLNRNSTAHYPTHFTKHRSSDNMSPVQIDMSVVWGCISFQTTVFCCQNIEQVRHLLAVHNMLNDSQQLCCEIGNTDVN